MSESFLKRGQRIDAIWLPADEDGEKIGGAVGCDGVTEIVIEQLSGPIGFFEVAIIHRAHQADEMVPVYAAEFIRLIAPADECRFDA